MTISLKDAAILGLAGLGAYFGIKALMRYRGSMGVGDSTQTKPNKDAALKHFLAGGKAVAESAKVALIGADAYRDKKESEAVRAAS
jgi:hypothetical protein